MISRAFPKYVPTKGKTNQKNSALKIIMAIMPANDKKNKNQYFPVDFVVSISNIFVAKIRERFYFFK